MRILLLLPLALALACTQPRSAACKKVCAREYECITQTSNSVPFDEKECVAACAALEADQDNLAKVQKHTSCVEHARACGAVLECQ